MDTAKYNSNVIGEKLDIIEENKSHMLMQTIRGIAHSLLKLLIQMCQYFLIDP